MLDDIGKAEPHMADAVPAMGVDQRLGMIMGSMVKVFLLLS